MGSLVQDFPTSPNLFRIPQELLLEIAKYLTLFDVYSLRNTCHSLHIRLGPEEQSIWRHLLSPDAERKPVYWKQHVNNHYHSDFQVAPTRPDDRPKTNAELDTNPRDHFQRVKLIRSGELAGCQMCLSQTVCADTFRARIFWKWICAYCLYYYFQGSLHQVAVDHPGNRFDYNLVVSHKARYYTYRKRNRPGRAVEFKQYLLSDINRVIREQLDPLYTPNTHHQELCASFPFVIEFLCRQYASPRFKDLYGFLSVEDFRKRLERDAEALRNMRPEKPFKKIRLNENDGYYPDFHLLSTVADTCLQMAELTPTLLEKSLTSDLRVQGQLMVTSILESETNKRLRGPLQFQIPAWIEPALMEWADASKGPPDGIPIDKIRLCPYCEKLTEEKVYDYVLKQIKEDKGAESNLRDEIGGTRLLAKHIFMLHFENLYEDWAFKPASQEFYSSLEALLKAKI
ncbi:hypothetical protein TWF506_004739 [Arthrobotrys conoides]|uniref:F-box domain-containing protein n=1 Tax=Arthrobotrys conoides TaxID=74498 RepID=A0AAN8P3J3_9PEZI